MKGHANHSLTGRRVNWEDLVPAHDNKTLFLKLLTGIILETHWFENTCTCIVVDKHGTLHSKPATTLVLFDSPLASTQPPKITNPCPPLPKTPFQPDQPNPGSSSPMTPTRLRPNPGTRPIP